eukprot:TRINITY_DN2378_c6_g1_i1.p1 TRINITY_DN2378_c6_g1~~TRINITY_DN2378_c6_g1_i1.p1  ORF type:complete len:524 (-),score=157.31 TRINITY_DN2378_c6_g1_i1:95-1666(-)
MSVEINLPQELVRGSFGCLEAIISTAEASGTSQELADVLVQFAVHHSIMEPLFQWLVQQEIDKTVFYSSVFREDCFAIQVLNTLLYSEKGTLFLKKLLTPIVQKATEIWKKEKRTLQLAGNIPTRIYDANLTDALLIVDNFLVNFSFTTYTCPIPLRQAFAIIQSTIESRFRDEITAELPPIGLDLIFFKFICPAIISAQKFIPKVRPEIQPSLITVSKLLNDLALNNSSRWNPRVGEFMNEKHPLLRSLFFTLIDHEAIKMAEENIQVETPIMSPVCRDKSADRVRQYMTNQFENQISDSAYEISAKFGVRKCEQFMKKLEHENWESHKKYRDISTFKLKIQDEAVCMKGYILIRAPINFVLKCYLDFGQKIARTQRNFIKEPTENFKLERCISKLPFPMTNRDAVVSTWSIRSSDPDRAFFVSEDGSQFFPPQKGLIRSKVHLSGTMAQSDKDGNTMMVKIAHADINGSVPRYFVDLINMEQTRGWKDFKKQVEKSWKKEIRASQNSGYDSVESTSTCDSG